jgi:hypothetical protein
MDKKKLLENYEPRPFITTLNGDGFTNEVDGDSATVPNACVYIGIWVPARVFSELAKFEYSENEPFRTGKTYWIDCMQSRIVNEVLMITEDLDDGFYLVAHFKNDRKIPFIFGKMRNCDLLRKIKEAISASDVLKAFST